MNLCAGLKKQPHTFQPKNSHTMSKDLQHFIKNELPEKLTLCVDGRLHAFVATRNGETSFVFQN